MEFLVLKGINLNTPVYRGFAPIKDIAAMSAPNPFNQDTNPEGLQRDLAIKHARESYGRAERSAAVPNHPRLWPEVLLNIRGGEVATITPIDESHNLWMIDVHEYRLDKTLIRPQISRIGGNHPVNYGDGNEQEDWPSLDVSTPFCLTVGLTPHQEAALFMDINNNQTAMNTSHSAHLRARLTETELLADVNPAL